MAGGWAPDNAVNDQMDATIDDALDAARRKLPKGESAKFCDECDAPIPEKRRAAIPGVRLCVACQSQLEKSNAQNALYNRRGNKDSQLK